MEKQRESFKENQVSDHMTDPSIVVYYSKVFSGLKEEAFSYYISRVESRRRERILRLNNEKEKARLLSGGFLLYRALCERLGQIPGQTLPFSVEYGKRGKPYLPDYPEIHFNLSHSGEYVCLALGDAPAGVDLQEKTRVRGRIAERFFTAADNQRLAECGSEEEKQDLFFRMWSIKESYLKLVGTGIGEGFSDFEICWSINAIYGGKKAQALPDAYFRETKDLAGYSFCVCFRDPDQKVVWRKLQI